MGGGRRGMRMRRIAALAAVLTALLVLHHPLMGAMPTADTGGWSAVSPMAAQAASTGAVAMPDVEGCSCLSCALTCPLMQANRPARLMPLSSPPAHRTPSAVARALAATPFRMGAVARTLTARATSHAHSARQHQTVLCVFLL